jgi:hypothetical protein
MQRAGYVESLESVLKFLKRSKAKRIWVGCINDATALERCGLSKSRVGRRTVQLQDRMPPLRRVPRFAGQEAV